LYLCGFPKAVTGLVTLGFLGLKVSCAAETGHWPWRDGFPHPAKTGQWQGGYDARKQPLATLVALFAFFHIIPSKSGKRSTIPARLD
jgi:hypothetical protein